MCLQEFTRARVPDRRDDHRRRRLGRRAGAGHRRSRHHARELASTRLLRRKVVRRSSGAMRRKAEEAAARLKLTAADLQRFGIIDEIVPEPLGGAHRDPTTVVATRSRCGIGGGGTARADDRRKTYERLVIGSIAG